MRMFSIVIVLSSFFLSGETWACTCSDYDEAVKEAPQTFAKRAYSSFRGVSLGNGPHEMRWHAQSLGFDTVTSYYVQDTAIAAIVICGDGRPAGRADFDRTGKMLRLSLKIEFFSKTPPFVRKFADDLFERYGVKPMSVDDDVCFQDVRHQTWKHEKPRFTQELPIR